MQNIRFKMKMNGISASSTPMGPKFQSNCLDKCYKNPRNVIINSTQDQILVKYVKINYKQTGFEGSK